ncbi:hypothetical protein [Brackiella oedipodis]|uniref:hypothetical protein n=1 Tax=Brackiella oedipodis TaxID=124225 RepID=UPI0004918CAA|nr:hypothetical protein [Brackiella oedipodis]
MSYIILAICCSVFVSVLLKLAKQQQQQIVLMVTCNYVSAIALILMFLAPNPWYGWQHSAALDQWLTLLGLGVLLPVVFVLMGQAVQHNGIVLAEAAQRLSLFLPILAAATLFGEHLGQQRLFSIILALLALAALLYKPSQGSGTRANRLALALLLLVWLGYGAIDILFKQFAKSGLDTASGLLLSFSVALVLSVLYCLLQKIRLAPMSVLLGLVMGIFNFANIYFYIRAHQVWHSSPTLVFTAMNIGVITVGTLIGALFFREKINKINALGLGLALTAIVCLFMS